MSKRLRLPDGKLALSMYDTHARYAADGEGVITVSDDHADALSGSVIRAIPDRYGFTGDSLACGCGFTAFLWQRGTACPRCGTHLGG